MHVRIHACAQASGLLMQSCCRRFYSFVFISTAEKLAHLVAYCKKQFEAALFYVTDLYFHLLICSCFWGILYILRAFLCLHVFYQPNDWLRDMGLDCVLTCSHLLSHA